MTKTPHKHSEAHKEKMNKRKQKKATRVATIRVKTGRYTPAQEDKKHLP